MATIKKKSMKISLNTIDKIIEKEVNDAPIYDLHTHLFPIQFSRLYLVGIDEILTYHYLLAEFFRSHSINPKFFFSLSKTKKADLIWQKLFIENAPFSEACVGVLTILKKLNIDPNQRLDMIRNEFKNLHYDDSKEYFKNILKIMNIKKIVMTNDPLDPVEISYWSKNSLVDSPFKAALRVDRLFNVCSQTMKINKRTYNLQKDVRLFLQDMVEFISPIYLSASLPDSFSYDSKELHFLKNNIFPLAEEYNLPVALMIGVRRGVNKEYGLAGDGAGKIDIKLLERICIENPKIKFLVSLLSRENQYDLIVLSRKFSNLIPFGSWWFLNNEFHIEEILEMRLLLIGNTFIPYYSDARVLEHLIYKWEHFKKILIKILIKKYSRIIESNVNINKVNIQRDIQILLYGNAQKYCENLGNE